MNFLTSKAFVASVLGVVLLVGCGGGSSSSTSVPAANRVVKYIAEMQATATNDSTEPRDISLVDLPADDAAEPDAV